MSRLLHILLFFAWVITVGYAQPSYVSGIDDIFEGGRDNTKNGITRSEITLNFTIPGHPVLSYNAQAHEVTVYTTGGETAGVISLPPNEGRDVFPVTVTDNKGNIYRIEEEQGSGGAVDENGDPVPPALNAVYLGKQEEPLPSGSFSAKAVDNTLAVVTFDKGTGFYAFDSFDRRYFDISKIADKYEHLAVGSDRYDVPWKFLPVGGSDVVKATLDIKAKDFDPSRVVFRTPQGMVFRSEYDEKERAFTVHLIGGEHGDAQEVYALYRLSASAYKTLGKLGVVSYNRQTQRLVIVKVNGHGSNMGSAGECLKEVYAPVGVDWQVSTDEFTYEGGLSDFFDKKSGLLTSCNEKMKALQAAYREEKGIDAHTCYLFILGDSGVKNSRDTKGFMPRGGQFGYLFENNISSHELCNIIAHELAHGRWRLRHTFDDTYGGVLKEKSTDNLMDYSGGLHIGKWQWDQIYDPAWVTSPFEGDEKGMISKTQTGYLCVDAALDRALRKNGYVLGANNKYFILSEQAVIKKIAYSDHSKNPAGQGAVILFEEGGKTFVASYNPATEEFISYKEAGVEHSDRKDILFENSIQGGYYNIEISGSNCTVSIDGQVYLLADELCHCSENTYQTEYARLFAKGYEGVSDDKIREQVGRIALLMDEMNADFLDELKEMLAYSNSPASDNPGSWDYYFKPLFRSYARGHEPDAERLKGVYNSINAYNKSCIDLGRRANEAAGDKFTSNREVVELVKGLSFGEKVRVAQAPFKKLSGNERKYLLKILCEGEISGRDHIAEAYRPEDIILLILRTASDNEIATTLKGLEAHVLYRLFAETDDHFYFLPGQFHELVIRVSNAVMTQDKVNLNEGEIARMLFERGDCLLFDNSYFGKKNTEWFSDSTGKICLKAGREIWRTALTALSPVAGSTVDFLVDGKDYSDKCYHPLEYLAIIPVRNIDYGFIRLQKGEMSVVPAILGYLIFKAETMENAQTTGMIAVNTALCAVGAGEVAAALKAGSVSGAILGGVDIALGAAGGVMNTVPEIAKDHPQFTEYYNYATVVYSLSRLGFVRYQGVKAKWAQFDDIFHTQKSVINQNKNIIANASNNAKGAFGEIASDVVLTEKGYTPLHKRKTRLEDGWGETGIDAVFEKDGQYYIVEAKYGTARLTPGNNATGLPKQMTDEWIGRNNRLFTAVGKQKSEDIINSAHHKLLAKVIPDGTVTYTELNASAEEIGIFIP